MDVMGEFTRRAKQLQEVIEGICIQCMCMKVLAGVSKCFEAGISDKLGKLVCREMIALTRVIKKPANSSGRRLVLKTLYWGNEIPIKQGFQ